MPIEKMGIRWGRKNEHLNREEKNLLATVIASCESLRDEVASLESEVRRLKKIIQEYAYTGDRSDLQ